MTDHRENAEALAAADLLESLADDYQDLLKVVAPTGTPTGHDKIAAAILAVRFREEFAVAAEEIDDELAAEAENEAGKDD